MRDLRVGIIGYGLSGRDFHAPLIRDAEGLRITHVVTGDAARAAQAAEDNPGVRVVATVAELLSHASSLDLVVVASASGVHVEHARAAVERGVPVVVDKPLATDLASGRALVERAREQKVPLTVFQNRRWDSEHLTARAVLGSGALGELVRYEARYDRWRPVPKSRWRENVPSELGGGLLMDLQPHLVDGALDLFGPVQSVYAELQSVTTVADDVSFLVLTHRTGMRSHLGATSLAGAPGPRTRILGREASYLVAGLVGEPTAFSGWVDQSEGHRGWLVRGADAEPVQRAPGGWGDYYPAVVSMLRESTPPPVDPDEAVAVLEVLDAARRSAREDAVIPLG
ncbi:MAG TPA: Gfo/Idh/MocA family oxidoreductase [Actinomycetes bacterium]|nr:Gfo/Idh/MocA family oxidoreductase [Actinomycetes bacterium]